MSKQLEEPILDHGIQNTNFFNGRLLTADDLKADQTANRQQHQQLGLAVGAGIVQGLEVKLLSPGSQSSLPLVSISKGIAVNRKGQTLSLPDDQQVQLVRKVDPGSPEAGLFVDCASATSTVTSLANGIYVLVVGPTSGFKERAPLKALNQGDLAGGCGSRYAVEGVKFRLARFDHQSFTGISDATRAQVALLLQQTDPLALSKLRNIVAQYFLGTEELSAIAREPLKASGSESAYATYGGVDFMMARGELGECEVPLAVVYWTGGLVRFLDMWSARRRIFTSARTSLSHLLSARRQAEAEARFFQFHLQLTELITSQPNPSLLIATGAFRFLPPAGLAPLRSGRWPAGVITDKFFLNKSFAPPTSFSGDKLQRLFHESLFHQPIDLSTQDRIQLYTVSENSAAQQAFNPPQPYLVFASQHLPYLSSQPRFAALCQTLNDSSDVYNKLLGRDVFFSTEASNVSIRPRLAVQAAIQHVAQLADDRHVAFCKCACALDVDRALELLNDLYNAQSDLVKTFLANWPGLSDTASLHGFANQLHAFLDIAIPPIKPSLHSAITAKDLKAATDAQNVINEMVRGWTGGDAAPTSGIIEVTFQDSPDGSVLVPRETAFNYIFRVRNGTNNKQTIQLNAGFLDPRADWNKFITILDEDDKPIESVTLEAGLNSPTDPNTFTNIKVSVVTPTDAKEGDKVTLRLTASVPPPINRTGFAQRDLTVGREAVVDPPASVQFSPDSPVSSRPLNSGKVGALTTLGYKATFHASKAPLIRSFIFHIIVTTTSTRQSYSIGFIDRTPDTSVVPTTSMDVFTSPFNLTSGQQESITVGITPLRLATGALPGPLTFTARLVSADDPNLKDEKANTITVTS